MKKLIVFCFAMSVANLSFGWGEDIRLKTPSSGIMNKTPSVGILQSGGGAALPSVEEILDSGLVFRVDKSSVSTLLFDVGLATWTDLSDSGFNLRQPTISSKPVTEIPLVTLNGTSYFMSAGDVLDFERTDKFSFFVVYQETKTVTDNIEMIVSKIDSTGQFTGYSLSIRGDVAGDPFEFTLENTVITNALRVRFTRPTTSGPHVISIIYDGSSQASGVDAYVDGVAQTETTVSNNLTATTLTSISFNIGARNSKDLFFAGRIGEVDIFNRKLTSTEVGVFNDYLVDKWVVDFPFSEALVVTSAAIPYSATAVPVLLSDTFSSSVNPYRGDSKDLLFMKSDLTTAIPHKVAIDSILERDTNAGWTFPSVGNAVASGIYRYLSWYDVDDDTWMIGQYNTETNVWTKTVLGTAPAAQKDDHNNPTLIVDSAGYIRAFCVEHHTVLFRMYQSNNPNDISAFTLTNLYTTLSRIDSISYAPVAYFPNYPGGGSNIGTIALMWREGISVPLGYKRKISLATVDNTGGIVFGTVHDLVTEPGERPYTAIAADVSSNTLHIFFTPAGPTEEDSDAEASLYHGIFNITNDTLYTSTNGVIGVITSTAFTRGNATLVDDMAVTASGSDAFFPYDAVVSSTGTASALYSLEVNDNDLRYRYATWNGTSWVTKQLTANGQSVQSFSFITGERAYSAAGTFLNANTIYLSKFDVDASSAIFGIHQFITNDGGNTFSDEAVIPHVGQNRNRPIAFRSHDNSVSISTTSKMVFAYMLGKYLQYDNDGVSGYNRSLDNIIGVWPDGGSETDVYAMLEIDTDGVTDYDFKMLWNHVSDYQETTPFLTSTITYAGEVENRSLKLDSSVYLSTRDNLTVVSRIHPDVTPPSATMDYLSDLETDGTGESTHVLFRVNSSRQLDARLHNASAFSASAPATDILITTNTWSGIGVKYASNVISQFRNGTKSTVTGSLTGPLNTTTVAEELRADQKHNSTLSWRGRIGPMIIYIITQTDDWLRAATLGLKGDAVTRE